MAENEGRKPPYSAEAEMSVLGAVLLDQEIAVEVFAILKEQDFYDEKHRIIYRICIDLDSVNSVIDLVTVNTELQKHDLLKKVGGTEHLARLTDDVPVIGNALHYARIVHNMSLLRQLISVSQENINESYSGMEDARIILDRAEGKIFKISEGFGQGDFVAIKDLVDDGITTFEKLRDARTFVTGIPSGFSELDQMTTGFHSGELIILAARPGAGKTSFALNVAEYLSLHEKTPVGIFSLEMSNEQLAQRLMCSLAGVSRQTIMKGTFGKQCWVDLTSAADQLSHAPVFIDDTPGIRSMELRARARHLKKRENVGLIIVDYLQLMRSDKGENRQQEIASISGDLKALSKELKTPILALSQLSRRAVAHEGPPRLSDLRESGAIEQDADLVMFLHDEGVEKGMDSYGFEDLSQREVLLKIGKQRNGPRGEIRLAFQGDITRFTPISREYL